jgi:hypothetical protein
MPVVGASGVGCVILSLVVENEKHRCKPMFKRHMWERGVLWGWCGRWFDHLVVCDVWEVGGACWLLKNKKSPVNRCLQGGPESVGARGSVRPLAWLSVLVVDALCRLCWCVARVVKSEKIPINRRLQGVEGGVGVVWG